MTLASEPLIGIPRPVLDLLARVRRRLLAASALRLFAAIAAISAVAVVVGVAADLAFVLPIGVRWALWGAWVASIGLVAAVGLARVVSRWHSWDALAAVAERPHPDLAERLTVAVGLADRLANGSPELIAALRDDAGQRARSLDLRPAVPWSGPLRRAVAGLLAVVALVVPAIVRPDPFGILLARFVAPWSDLDRIGRFSIAIEPGDVSVAVGDDLNVSAKVQARYGSPPAEDAVDLEWLDGLGKSHRVRMKPDAAGFSAVAPRLASTIHYRVVAAGSPSRRHTAEVIEPPAIASVSAEIEPPAYTNLPTSTPADPGRLEAWRHSRIAFQVRPDRPLKSLKVVWPNPESPDEPIEAALQPPTSGDSWTVSVDALASGPYRFLLEDDRGLRNRRDADRTIVVRPDAPPTVALLGPESSREEKVRPDDLLRGEIAARDDLGLAILELHYEIQPADSRAPVRSGTVPAAFDPPGATIARASATIDLRPLGLQPGDVVSYRARAVDTLPPPEGPNEAWSDTRTLQVSDQAKPLAARRAADSRFELQAELEALKKAAADNRRQTEPLRYAADAALRGNGRWDETRDRELAAREPAAADVADRLEQVARDLEADPRFDSLADSARQTARVEAEAAREALADAVRDHDPADRLADLQKADNRQAAVQARIEDLQKRFNALAKLDDDRQKLDDLARRQDDLARRTQDLDAADRAQRDQAQAEQERLRRELDELTRNSPALKAELLARRAQEAADLVQKARDLAARQRDEARATVEFPRDDPRFQALADAQRQLEEDARRLALDVDPPLLQNGRGGINPGLLANAVEPLQQGDLEQSRNRLIEGENSLRHIARDLDDLANDPRALARRLAHRQDDLANRVTDALRPFSKPPDNPDDQADMAKRLKPFHDREAAIAQALGPIPANDPPVQEALAQARQALQKADEALDREPDPRQVETRHREAVQALNRLAETLPDPNKRIELARQKAGEARQKVNEAAQGIDQAIRETAPQPGKPYDHRQANADLAHKLEPIAGRLAEAAAALEAMPVESRTEPHRDRAQARDRALQAAIDQFRNHLDDPDQAGDARQSLRPLTTAAQAGVDRLEQKLHDWITPADELAEDLADEARQDGASPRLVNALRDLHAPDADALKTEAVRLAREAAREADPDRRQKAAREAAAAVETLADRLNDRLPAHREAAALAEAARNLDPQAQPQTLARQQQAIADAATHLHDRDAAQATRLAADLANRAAGITSDGPEPTPAAQEIARAAAVEALDALARRETQNDPPAESQPSPRATAEAIARRQHALAQRNDLAHLENDQKDPALAVEAIPENRAETDPARQQADHHREAARTAQQKAAEAIAAQDPQTARDEANRAADALDRLARVLPGPAGSAPPLPGDPSLALDPARTHDVRQLAQRERKIRDGLKNLLGERAESQQGVRDQATQLGQEIARLRDAVWPISAKAHEPARQAADLLQHQAPWSMDRAAEALTQGQPDPARDAQRKAAELAEQAAQRAEDLAAALRAEAATPQGQPSQPGLATAEDAQNQAARELAQAREPGRAASASQAAALAMKQAAEALQAAAEPPSQAVAQQPAQAEPQPREIGRTDADLSRLQTVLRSQTGRSWGDLPGHLRTELLQMSQGRYRDDYARLIQLYFREIATASPDRNRAPKTQP